MTRDEVTLKQSTSSVAGSTSNILVVHPLEDDVEKFVRFDGEAQNYLEVDEVNLLDTRQSTFDNVEFSDTVSPEDRYEVAGSGGGYGASHGTESPILVDVEKLGTNKTMWISGVDGNDILSDRRIDFGVYESTIVTEFRYMLREGAPARDHTVVSNYDGDLGAYSFQILVKPSGTLAFQTFESNGVYSSSETTNAIPVGPLSIRIEYDMVAETVDFYTSELAHPTENDWNLLEQVTGHIRKPMSGEFRLGIGSRPSANIPLDGALSYLKVYGDDKLVVNFDAEDFIDVSIDETQTTNPVTSSEYVKFIRNTRAYRNGVVHEAGEPRYNNGLLLESGTENLLEEAVAAELDGTYVTPTAFTGEHVASSEALDIDARNVGAPSANKPMLVSPRRWGVEQVLYLPGRSGNYAKVADTNLMPARIAHIDSGEAGDWSNFGSSVTIAKVDEPTAPFGEQVLELTRTSDSSTLSRALSATVYRVAVTAGQVYTFGAWMRGVTRNTTLTLSVAWRDAAGTFISEGGTVISDAEVSNATAGEWHYVERSFTAPAGAEATAIQCQFFSGAIGAPPAEVGDKYQIAATSIRAGDVVGSQFAPSLRITGDIDLRVQAAAATWNDPSVGGADVLLGLYALPSSEASYNLRIDTLTGGVPALALYWTEDGAVEKYRRMLTGGLYDHGVSDQQPVWLRATMDVDDGAGSKVVEFLRSDDGFDWDVMESITQVGTTSIFAGGSTPRSLQVGARQNDLHMDASFLRIEVRDGIDGPVVASVDFTNTDEVTGDTWTTPEGLPGEVVRGGVATAELVQRSAWAVGVASSSPYAVLTLPEVSSPADGMRSVFGLMHPSSFSGAPRMFDTGGYGTVGSWGMTLNGQVFANPGTGNVTVTNGRTVRLWAPFLAEFTDERLASWNQSLTNVIETPADVSGTANDPATTPYVGSVGGSRGEPAQALVAVFATFPTTFDENRRAELAAWDGSVATEPEWLREAALEYVNADDPTTWEAYDDDVVVNLGGAPVRAGASWGYAGADDGGTDTGDAPFFFDVGPQGEWGVDRALFMPGTGQGSAEVTGVDVKISESNLLTMKDANHYQEASGNNYDAQGATYTHVTNDGLFSGRSTRVTVNQMNKRSRLTGIPSITAGTTYTFSFAVKGEGASVGSLVRPVLRFYSDGGPTIAAPEGADVTLTDEWQRISFTYTAPAGADRLYCAFRHIDVPTGESFLITDACLRTDGSSDFIPAVSPQYMTTWEVDWRAELVVARWAEMGTSGLMSQRSYPRLVLKSNQKAQVQFLSDGAFGGSLQSATIPYGDGEKFALRAVIRRVDDGTLETDFYHAPSLDGPWTLNANATHALAADDSHYGLMMGARDYRSYIRGALLRAEVRDGDDGPVVLSADFTDPVDVPGDVSWTTEEGQTLTMLGDMFIVDEPALTFSSEEFVTLPARDEFVFPVGTDFTLLARALGRGESGRFLLGARGTGFSDGYNIRLHADEARIDIQTTAPDTSMNTLKAADGVSQVEAGVSGATVFIRVDGGTVGTATDPSNDPAHERGAGHEFMLGAASPGFGAGNRHIGHASLVAVIPRALTIAESDEFGAWDGTLTTEPAWLRGASSFYWSAHDPLARATYLSDGEMVNLATTINPLSRKIYLQAYGAKRVQLEAGNHSTSWQNPADGTRDHETVKTSSSVVNGRESGTIALWFDLNNHDNVWENGNAHIVEYVAAAKLHLDILSVSEDLVRFRYRNNSTMSGENVFLYGPVESDLTGRHLVVLTYDDDGTRMYVDGVLTDNESTPARYSSAGSNFPRWNNGGLLNFELLDELHLRRSLTDQEVADLYAAGPGNYEVDEDTLSYINFVDSFDGMYSQKFNADRDADTGLRIIERDAWSFGGGEKILIDDREWADFGTEDSGGFYIGAGIDRDTAQNRIVDTRGGSEVGAGLLLYVSNGYNPELRMWAMSNDEVPSYASVTIPDREYHVYQFEIDRTANVVRGDVDGNQPSTASFTEGQTFINDGPVILGHSYNSVGSRNTTIYWVAFFRRLLTESEKSTLFAWDGSIETEPVWLRPLASFYINANDPTLKERYNG